MENGNNDISDGSTSIRYPRRCRLSVRVEQKAKQFCLKEERNASLRTISAILQKSEKERSVEEAQFLHDCPETVEEVQLRWKKREEAKRRLEEIEDPEKELQEKCYKMAQAMVQAQHLIIYTGAGISTAAKIPDYRGPNGIWTKLQQGKDIGKHDLSSAEPTYTHMALSQLYHQNILKHVVSQNCDGLHLRSGLPRFALSELHGNMLIEVCKNCRPSREYLRSFDVTENTARYSHKTMRKCYFCNRPLFDTIVHFGERGTLRWPLNWKDACKNAKKASMIICLGSSLKVLKRYPWLWQMDKPVKKRPILFIVNLQWTPKDDFAFSKIHGKCDKVMRIVMNALGILVPEYNRIKDPVFHHLTELCKEELHTTTRRPFFDENIPSMKIEDNFVVDKAEEKFKIKIDLSNGINFKMKRMDESQLNFNEIYFNCLKWAGSSEVHYSDLRFYPYLTNYMYPGLHSIISQPPSLSNFTDQQQPNKVENNKDLMDYCNFCFVEYHSPICLFYPKFVPLFSEVNVEEQNSVCFCCEDDKTGCKEPINFEDGSESKSDDNIFERSQNKAKSNPGWFGKGYSKNRKRRKS